MTDPIIFEFPLTQSYRHFLRLEAAFKHFEHLLTLNHRAANQACLLNIINILEFLSRVEIKSEVIKELEYQTSHYQKLKQNPAVDTAKLDKFLQQLKKLHQWAISYRGRLGDDLREQPLLKNILTKQSIHTGVAACDSPELARFCQLDNAKAQSHLINWYQLFDGLKTSINVILRLTRELSVFQVASAPMGDYLIEKPNPGNTLLRLQLTANEELFPEVSAGKHRISLHFFSLNDKLDRIKCRHPVDFKYATCGWKE